MYLMVLLAQWAQAPDHPHKVAYFTVIVPEIICLLLSSAYHLFMAQVKHYDMWLKIDVRCLCLLLLSCMLDSVLYSTSHGAVHSSQKHVSRVSADLWRVWGDDCAILGICVVGIPLPTFLESRSSVSVLHPRCE